MGAKAQVKNVLYWFTPEEDAVEAHLELIKQSGIGYPLVGVLDLMVTLGAAGAQLQERFYCITERMWGNVPQDSFQSLNLLLGK